MIRARWIVVALLVLLAVGLRAAPRHYYNHPTATSSSQSFAFGFSAANVTLANDDAKTLVITVKKDRKD